MPWVTYTRGTILPYFVDMVLRGVFLYSKRLNGLFVETLYINSGSKLEWSWNEKEIFKAGSLAIQKCSTEKKFLRHAAKLERINKKAIKAADKFRKKDLRKLKKEDLIRQFSILDRELLPARGFLDVEVDSIDLSLENHFIGVLRSELKNRIDDAELLVLYKKISRPMYLSYIQQEQRDLLKAVFLEKAPDHRAEDLYEKYWWSNMGWENHIPQSKAGFLVKLRRIKNQKNLQKKLFVLENSLKKIKAERSALIRKYKISKRVQQWIKVVDFYSRIHDERKEAQLKSLYAYYLILKEAERRLDLREEDLLWLWHDEIAELLRGKKFDRNLVEERKKAVASRVSIKGISRCQGQKALELRDKELTCKTCGMAEIKGMPVTWGKVRGVVKVCSGYKEALLKIKSSKDILICPMTLPDYVPAMKKARAIVTDEGGITCHAAIISRELGKPCIVGTKNSTKILKDGDLIEVDADKGVVKIIN